MAHLETQMFNPAEIAAAITAPKPETVAWIFQSHENRINAAKREIAAKYAGSLWSMPCPITVPGPMTQERAEREALHLERRRAVYAASPKAAILKLVGDLEDEGDFSTAEKVRSAVSRGADLRTHIIDAGNCGSILSALAGITTPTAAAIIAAVAENLKAVG